MSLEFEVVEVIDFLNRLQPILAARCDPDNRLYRAVMISELDLSVRSYNCLKKYGVITLAALVGCTAKELLQIRNFGEGSLAEVRGKLVELGLHLSGEDPNQADKISQRVSADTRTI